jgi:hypothetical protein
MTFPEATMGGTAARHLDLFASLPDPVIDTLVEAGRQASVEIRHWGGAMARPAPDAGPVGHRDTRFSVIVDDQLPGLADALRPHAGGGSFLNFLSDPARTRSAYTPGDFRRLGEVKRTYDPGNVLRVGHAVPPS